MRHRKKPKCCKSRISNLHLGEPSLFSNSLLDRLLAAFSLEKKAPPMFYPIQVSSEDP